LEFEFTPAEGPAWRRGSVEDWANEPFRAAQEEIYSKLLLFSQSA